MTEFVDFWKTCVARLEREISEYQFDTWVGLLTTSEKPEIWEIYAPTQFIFELVRDNFLHRIEEIKNEVAGSNTPNIKLKVGRGTKKVFDFRETDPTAKNGIALDKSSKKVEKAVNLALNTATRTKKIFSPGNAARTVDKVMGEPVKQPAGYVGYEHTRLRSELTFENLVEGKSNKLAYNAGIAICDALGKKDYNPFFVYGSTGLGKTHLAQAIANRIFGQGKTSKIRYINADKFVNEFVKYVRRSDIEGFKKVYQNLDLLILDDVQFIAGKEKTMEEFFYLFNHLLEKDNQIILTSDRLPSEIEKLDKRLISRFSWGLTVEIEPPELEMRVAILNKKADSAHFRLPQDIAFFIAQTIKSNVRDLEGALNRIKAHCMFTHEPLTIELAKTALKDIIASSSKKITIEDVQKVVSDYCQVSLLDIRGTKRTRDIVRPRQMAMALAKELTENSLPAIGAAFGGKDHTTVIHACKIINNLRAKDAELNEKYTLLTSILTN